MKTSDFDYHLPRELIAQTPVEPRDISRLMVVSRAGGSIRHRRFRDLPEFLRAGDVLVFNDSRVFPARLYGRRSGTSGKVEMLLLSRASPGMWRALVRPGRRMGAGTVCEFGDKAEIGAEILRVEPDGSRTVRLTGEENIDRIGAVPLPPYIHRPLEDSGRYQTVYARTEGSVAAPTAGLHFTECLLDRVRAAGVETVFVTLHVGWDSFRPVRGEDPSAHDMHSEWWELGPEAAGSINRAKQDGRRVISVGTTAVRLLEQAAALHARHPSAQLGEDSLLSAGSGWASLFILPGYRFRVIDALVTNFHLPRSTLLMLTSAFAGRDLVLEAYRQAIDSRYRFYSFGDAMFIL